VWVALAEEAEHVLVDEVEVEEAVNIADGGVVAEGMSLVGVGESAEDVPGSGDEQEQDEPGDGFERAPATPLAGEEQVRDGGAGKEDRCDQSLGERGQGDAGIDPVNAQGAIVFKAGDEGVEGDEQKEAELGLGNDEAGEEKRADGSENSESGIEAGARAPGAARPEPREPGKAEDGQGVGQVSGKGVFAEYLVACSDHPEGQGRFFNVAKAVDFRSDQVAGVDHVLGELGVAGVDVVQQRGRKERGKLHGGKNSRQEHPYSEGGRGLLGAME
jgi:hypothetical protein